MVQFHRARKGDVSAAIPGDLDASNQSKGEEAKESVGQLVLEGGEHRAKHPLSEKVSPCPEIEDRTGQKGAVSHGR